MVFRVGDRIRVLVSELRPESKGPMVVLSRTHPLFMAKLFEQEVPEIYEGVIQIKSVARDPGSRAKIAVYTADPNIDPVGSCVGMRGARVQAIVTELRGEKVDIIPWSANPATFVVNALAPAEVSRVVLDEDSHKVQVVVAEEQLSLAIGRRGQNVRLASILTGWGIDIVTEEDDSRRRSQEMAQIVGVFTKALDVDDMVAQLLASEGFGSVEEIAYIDPIEFASIEGFDEEIGAELQRRAMTYLQEKETHQTREAMDLGASEDLVSLEGMSGEILMKLVNAGLKTRDDLADLAVDELIEILGQDSFSNEEAHELIMRAREHWFEA